MALYPNGRYLTSSPGRHFGPAPGLDKAARNNGDRWNRFTAGLVKTTTTPEGYGMRTPWAPIKAGGLAGKGSFAFTIAGNVLAGGPMTGAGSFALTAPDASLSMIASLSGSGAWTLQKGLADLRGVVTLSGAGSITLNGQGNLGATVPMSGSGSWSLSGSGDIRMKLSLTGGWTPYTELSPENLAANVWGALASANNDAGTMGELLNSAGAAADPLLGVVEGTLTLRDVQRIVLAVLAGQVTGAGSGTETFKGQGGEDRVVSVVDNDGNRSSVTLDAS